jgi:hypothetical protein
MSIHQAIGEFRAAATDIFHAAQRISSKRHSIIIAAVALVFLTTIYGQMPESDQRAQTRSFTIDIKRLDELRRGLDNRNSPDVRKESASALGKSKDKRAIPYLIHELKDGDDQVWQTVINALIEIGPPAIEPLVRSLKPPIGIRNDVDVREQMENPLYRNRELQQEKRLREEAREREESRVREGAAVALGGIKDVRALEPLAISLKDSSAKVRKAAARALLEIDDKRAVDFLLSALQKKDFAIIALEYDFFIQRGESGTEAVLIKALDSCGDPGMAERFVSSGNSLLEAAGDGWAKQHAYSITNDPSFGDQIKWGAGRR